MRSPWFRRVTEGTECGALARETDWAATPIGPPSTWPPALRVVVELCFTTRFPVLVTWGPDLTMIYNDGYRDMLGSDKHPGAMGAAFAEVWKEIWDDLAPSVDRVLQDGEPTWSVDQHLVMNRSGYDEDTYFTYSYSPLRDSSDVVRGLLDIATETTEQVVERRRMRLLGDLSVRLTAAHGDVQALAAETMDLMRDAPDVVAAELHLVDGDGALALTGTTGSAGVPAVPADVLARVARTATAEDRGRALVVPLLATGDPAASGVLVLAAGSRRPWDDAYRAFFGLVASAVGAAVSGTLRHLEEVDELRHVSDTLQAAIVPGGSVLPGVVARYVPAVGDLAVGGDWYDVLELAPGTRALVVGDCVGHGLDAAARMGQLRAAARSLLLDGRGPGAVLDGLDRFARTLPGAECTTVFCGIVDEVQHTLTYSLAGHLPPVLQHAGAGTVLLQEGRGAALAISDKPHPEAVEALSDGDLLVVCTDGLVERRTESLAVALERLAAVVAGQPLTARTAAVADDLLRTLVPNGADDDVALVVYRAGSVEVPGA
ncbi:SpoIIE family protein phosphatase [Cellulomonas hominis]|uniref:SpoIIE family protein phosphatase n=1 Tax=Cellulomonas hominis TaxID=156981 RepID=UPI001B9AC361|nr:SpoIIE family protein phosphatase [Cellulomonas hominis]VTR76725.1 Phosphoserine phosphatase RsbU [Cellulomonas hominis]